MNRFQRLVRIGVSAVVAACLMSGTACELPAQMSPELSSLDIWIVQRYRGAQLLPDSNSRVTVSFAQAGAPRIESSRTPAHRDTVVALHFGTDAWRPTLGAATPVQLADPTGVVSSIPGRVTARRAFRAPRVAGARDTVGADWRFGWAYLVALPAKSASAAPSGFNGWAVVQDVSRGAKKPALQRAQQSGTPSSPPPAAPSTSSSAAASAQSAPPRLVPAPATQPPIH